MRLPKRLSQTLRDQDTSDDVIYLTPQGKAHLERELVRIERDELPPTLASMQFALTLGDFSENAEYQEAKGKLARLHTRVLTINDRLRRAILLTETLDSQDAPSCVQLGSRVRVRVGEKERLYQLVGSHEANPSAGRLSHRSPVGAALIGKRVGESVSISREDDTPLVYTILSIDPLASL